MEVVEHTATRLTLQDKTVLSYWRVGCLYTLGTAAVFAILAAPFTLFSIASIHSTLTLDRKLILTCVATQTPAQNPPQASPETCRLVRSRLIGQRVTTIPLADLKAAVVKSESRTPPKRLAAIPYYWVELETKTKPIRFIESDANESSRQDAIAAQINAFIKYPKQPLQVEQEVPDFAWIPALLLLPLGLLPPLIPLFLMSGALLYLLRGSQSTFDKTQGTLTVEYQGIKLLKKSCFNKTIQQPLEAISAVQVEPFLNNKYWNLVVVLKTGKRISLIWMGTPGREEKEIMAHRISRFLDLD